MAGGLAIASTGLAVNGSISDCDESHETPLPVIREHRRLGRTGFMVSDIGCGATLIQEESLLRAVLDRGVNYIDAARQYNNERVIARAIEGYERESLFITSKVFVTQKKTSEDLVREITNINSMLNAGYIDCIMMHAASSEEEITSKPYEKAITQLKKEGVIRFCGVSCHGQSWYNESVPMDLILNRAIDVGFYDVLLLVYNYVQSEMGENILKRCKENDIGTTIMKTDPFGGAYQWMKSNMEAILNEGRELPPHLARLRERYEDKHKLAAPFLEKYGIKGEDSLRDSAFRFVLNNPDVHSVLATIQSFEDIDKFVRLSGQRFDLADKQNLSFGSGNIEQYYCRHACGICEPACPHNVPLNTIMRYNNYFIAQKRVKESMSMYHRLNDMTARHCINCTTHPCQSACPFGVQIHELLLSAHSNLSIS